MQTLTAIGILVFAGLLTSLPSCANTEVDKQVTGNGTVERSDPTPSPTPDIAAENFRKAWEREFETMKNEIEAAREKWSKKEIQSYTFVARKDIGGVSSAWNRSPVRITVESGRMSMIEIVDKSDISMYARTDGFEEFDTIDKLFDYMLRELESGRMVRADYESTTGYPEFVSVVWSFALDHNGRSITISSFSHVDSTKAN